MQVLLVLQVLAMVYQGAFQDEQIYQRLITFVKNSNDVVCEWLAIILFFLTVS